MSTSQLSRTRFGALPAATAVLLVATVLVPLLAGNTMVLTRFALALSALSAAAWIIAHHIAQRPHRPGVWRRLSVRPTVEMVLHLSPVLLLTFIFPIAVSRIADARVGGVGLTTLLLASSLTVPWLSMAVCLPLYRAVGHLMPSGDLPTIRTRFCEVWPSAFLQTAPALLVFAIPVELVMRWSIRGVAAYILLCLLHMAFAQSLILANIGRNRLQWAAAWIAYAGALFLFPMAWFLPPLAGLATQLLPLRHDLMRMRRLVHLDPRDVAADVGRGVLLGAVLWSHLLFFFLATSGKFAVTTVFIAVLPAVLAYNYYFVRLAPAFDQGVLTLRAAMENEPHATMVERSRSLATVVETSISRTAFIGAVLGFFITYAISVHTDISVALVATIAVASWLFLMTTLLCYKLDYIGATTEAQLLSAAHLAICAGAFFILPAGATLYAWLIGLELLVFGWALHSCLKHWRSSEYSLFWRHATAW